MSVEQKRVAIVTGAGGGIGEAIAREVAQQGFRVVLADLHAQALQRVADDLRATTEVQMVAGDITDGGYRAQLMAALGDREVSLLAHAAGVSPTMADGQRIFAVNFTATQQLVETVLPRMAAGGAAVLIASNSGQLVAGWPFDAVVKQLLQGQMPPVAKLMLRSPRLAYPLSKRAVQRYASRMAPAFGARSARIVSVSPGMIDTSMARREQAASAEMARMLAVTPAQRMGAPKEIAAVVAFLASPAASYISGTDILVDGGTIAGIHAAGGMRKLLRKRVS